MVMMAPAIKTELRVYGEYMLMDCCIDIWPTYGSVLIPEMSVLDILGLLL